MAAAAGALTTSLFFHPHFSLSIPHYGQMQLTDIFSGAVVVAIAIALGMVAVWCLPRLHRLMHRLKHPVLILGMGGFILGVLGAIGGTVTLFKGLDEMQQLAFSQVFSVSDYLLFALVKLAALVVAAACGFRGGRIFPAVFVGVALGLMLHEHVDAVPAAITVSCSILGLVLVVTRDAWLSLFMAAVVVPDTTLLPLMVCHFIQHLRQRFRFADAPALCLRRQAQRLRYLRPVPEGNIVIALLRPVDGPFHRVSFVVKHQNNRALLVAQHGSQLLNGQLRGAVARQDNHASIRTRRLRAKRRRQRVANRSPQRLDDKVHVRR